jgi:hypothetical protein
MSAESSIEDLRAQFKSAMSMAAVELLPEYIQKLRDSDDPEDVRKFLALATEVNGWKEPPPKNGMENLPVFHFNIGGAGGVSIQARVEHADGSSESALVNVAGAPEGPTTSAPLPLVEEVPQDLPQLPTPSVFANNAKPLTPRDVIDLDALLDATDD